jgi:hypothetical protein
MDTPFLAMPAQLEAQIARWSHLAGDNLRVDKIVSYSGHPVFALTLSDFTVGRERKRAHYFAQPHAHEPGATAGMIAIIEELATGRDLNGARSTLDIERILAQMALTFNPIGNPQGRERAAVLCWDGSRFTNQQFLIQAFGEDPDHPGCLWNRLGLWDRRAVRPADPIGIVYEQVDEHRYVEPNRSQLSSYFRLFHQLDAIYHYDRWLDLHQTEFERSPHTCEVLLPISGLVSGRIEQEDIAWGRQIIAAWQRAGFRADPDPRPLSYTGQQADYFRQNWADLHARMNCLSTEVKNNAADAPAEFQLQAQAIAIRASIETLLI